MKEKKQKLPVVVEEPFFLKDLKFSFNLSDADYQIDVLQNELLQTYLRADPRFRRAFNQNYTSQFLQFLRDKMRLNEPTHLSIMGQVRSGKSYIAISLATYLMACHGKRFGIDYICGNSYEFVEKLKNMPQDKLDNTCFVIDEAKQSVYGIGSVAKKMKITDVANIIAIRGISTISLTPNMWSNKEAFYGLRLFGRCFKTKTCRMMLYNLQAGGKSSELPLGNLYLPIFTAFLPKDYAQKLEKEYLEKKNAWVLNEQRGEGDILYEMKKKSAESFCRDKKYLELTKRGEKETYISVILGSEWTSREVEQIYEITKLIQKGMFDA
jgi:hypothetical protein